MGSKKTLFIVEDDTRMQFTYKLILKAQYDVHCFDNGEAMLKVCGQITPALAIIDLGLPGKDGYETCDAFTKKDGMDKIPVIFITGSEFSQDGGRAFSSGGSDYIQKPIDAESLLTVIAKHFEPIQ